MKAELLSRDRIPDHEWDNLVNSAPQGSIYIQCWYMDIIAPGWKGICVWDKAGLLCGLMPINYGSKLLLKHSLQPQLSKYWGMAIRPALSAKPSDQYSHQKQVAEAVLSVFPKEFSFVSYNLSPNYDYALPFHWQGYSLYARYTFLLNLQQPYEHIQANYPTELRREIRIAREQGMEFGLSESTENLELILSENAQEGHTILESRYFSRLREIGQAALKRNQAIIPEVSYKGRVIAAGIILRDEKSSYYMIGNMLRAYRTHHPLQLMTDEIIRLQIGEVAALDFSGMMDRRIESFWRKFGPVPKSYINIRKSRIPLKGW